MKLLITPHRKVSPSAVAGFALPFLLAVAVGLLINAHSKPIRLQQVTATSGNTDNAPATPPTASEIAAANAAILAYCSSDLRADTTCALAPNSNKTSPGFVESGIIESGHYETGDNTTQGIALAKGSGGTWSVLWLGQGCVPQNIASTSNVPASFGICST